MTKHLLPPLGESHSQNHTKNTITTAKNRLEEVDSHFLISVNGSAALKGHFARVT